MRLLFIYCALSLPAAAQVCNPADLHGAYGFQLSGTSMISGKPSPLASVGRLVFDDHRREISGYSSVNFNGYFLGNPVTGSYEAATDCSVKFKLQDDSGNFQNFSGTMDPSARSISVYQSDQRSGAAGTLVKAVDVCKEQAFKGAYRFTMSGSSTPFAGRGPRVSDSASATAEADGAGGLTIGSGEDKTTASYSVDSDCFVQITLGGVKLRGILVNGGDELLAIQTDPDHVAAARFRRAEIVR